MKQIVLIDGKYLAYKMHFSHLNLQTTGRVPTGLLYGFLQELLSLNRKLPEARIIICWDGIGKTWRHGVFEEYKANRKVNPEMRRMAPQIELLLPMLRKLGFWVLKVDGVEADDMIGMVATMFGQAGNHVRIYSKDRDMYQLVDKNIWMWPDPKLPPLRRKDIEHWLGAPFVSLLDIRAMAGDPGDNLKGLPGVGIKTAAKFWQQGFRVSTMKISHIALCQKFKADLPRVFKEYQLAKIVTSWRSDVWSDGLKKELQSVMLQVSCRPERDHSRAERNRREFYKFLGEYELVEILAARHKLLRLP